MSAIINVIKTTTKTVIVMHVKHMEIQKNDEISSYLYIPY